MLRRGPDARRATRTRRGRPASADGERVAPPPRRSARPRRGDDGGPAWAGPSRRLAQRSPRRATDRGAVSRIRRASRVRAISGTLPSTSRRTSVGSSMPRRSSSASRRRASCRVRGLQAREPGRLGGVSGSVRRPGRAGVRSVPDVRRATDGVGCRASGRARRAVGVCLAVRRRCGASRRGECGGAARRAVPRRPAGASSRASSSVGNGPSISGRPSSFWRSLWTRYQLPPVALSTAKRPSAVT